MFAAHSPEQWSTWMDRLAEDHFVVMDHFLPEAILQVLLTEFATIESRDEFKAARVGESTDRQRISEIRSDFIHWIDRQRDQNLAPFFDLIETVQSTVSRELFLSLSGFEFHFAKYPPGAFYKPHLDQFETRSNRQLSFIIYLNTQWTAGDGGELHILTPKDETIAPIANRAILFRSDTVLHEVLPAVVPRRSLTGWLLKQPSGIGVLHL